jgi:hypothetical protein
MKIICMLIFAVGLFIPNLLFGEDLISDNNEIDASLQKISESADGFPPYFSKEIGDVG